MHAQMKHTLANLQDLIPTWQVHIYKQHKPAKVGIKSCRFARVCFICACMADLLSWNCVCYDQLDIASLLLVSLHVIYCLQ